MGKTFSTGLLTNGLWQDASNNIGIGGSPSGSYKLEVTGTGRFSGALTVDAFANSATTYITFRNGFAPSVSGGLGFMAVDHSGSGTDGLACYGHDGISLYTAQTERMRITSSGNVGISTSSPVQPFQLGMVSVIAQDVNSMYVGANFGNGTGGDYIKSQYANQIHFDSAAGNINFRVAGSGTAGNAISYTTAMRITSGGNVLIGSTNDQSSWKAQVTGNIFIRGNNSTSANTAIYTDNSSGTTLFSVRNDGAVSVPGSLSKGSGSFRIEHPLESLSKTHQLVHSFIEGPQADLIYRGKLALVNGKAQANIDKVSTMTEGTFEALCREVQCFTTNESGWDLVKGKVIGNIIYIESQNANSSDEISWMVIGERKDKHMMDTEWTDENGKVIVEPLKRIELVVPSEPINQD